MLSQDNWRWCNKCQGLAFGGASTLRACQADSQHDHSTAKMGFGSIFSDTS
jgi:hypothetical protein